jgi:eukaryotic-like serine/threonine-protein kinase
MWFGKHDSKQDHLSTYWNALNRGAPAEELARLAAPLDQRAISAIDRARALHTRRLPDPAFANRLESDLKNTFATTLSGSVPLLPARPGSTNGRLHPHRPRSWPRLRFPAERRRWAMAQFATALLLIVTLIAIWYSFRPESQNAVVPNQSTPIPAPSIPHNVPMFRGDPAHSGVMPGPGPVGTPSVLWRHEAGNLGTVTSSTAVVDGVVYFITDDYPQLGVVVALDAHTGALLWSVALPTCCGGTTNQFSSPAVAGGLVYVSMPSALYAFDTATGAVRWHALLTGNRAVDIYSSPTVVGDTVYESGYSSPAVLDGVVYSGSTLGDTQAVYTTVSAFDAATGTLQWQTEEPGTGVFALDAATGAIRWSFPTDSDPRSSPTVAGGFVYAEDDGGVVHAIDAATGQERWQQQIGDSAQSSPAIANGVVYVGANVDSGNANFVAFDAVTGEERWRFEVIGISSSAAVVNGVVYFGTWDHHLYALDAETGQQKWALELDNVVETSPAVVGGTIYIGAGAYGSGKPGYVYAVGNGPTPATPFSPEGTATP